MGIISLPPPILGLTGGASDSITLGTGGGRPGGIENILEYNGALLNMRSWFDTYLITGIDGLADADIRDTREVNPGRHGETAFSSFYGGRTIVLTGKIRAMTLDKMRDLQMGLKQVFGDISKERALTFRTTDISRDVLIYCKKSQSIAMTEVQSDYSFRRDFQITLRASNPRFLSYLEELATALAASYVGTTTTINVSNNGNFEADPVIKIYGALSALTNGGIAGVLSRSYTDPDGLTTVKSMTLRAKAGTTSCVAAGNFLEINSSKRTIKEYDAAGNFVRNSFDQLDLSSDWLDLPSGSNTITFTVNSADKPQVEVRHRHTYL